MLRDFQFSPGPIPGLIMIQPKVFEDERGFFMEDYNQKVFADNGINIEFIQDNHAKSTRGVLRGMHFQRDPMAQDKLVRVIVGEVYDVVVDIRPGSATYGQHFGVNLSAENKQIMLVPKGFAHGYQVLSETAEFVYKVSNYYSPENDAGILWNDPALGIQWPIDTPILSDKDQRHPRLSELT